MKIGINNIFTSFWFFLMLVCGGTLTYFSFDRNLFTGDLVFIAKFFVGLIILITIGILFYFLYKFRILIIDKNKIISNWLAEIRQNFYKIKRILRRISRFRVKIWWRFRFRHRILKIRNVRIPNLTIPRFWKSQIQDSRISESSNLESLHFEFSKSDVEIKKFIKFLSETLKIKIKNHCFLLIFDWFSIIF